MPHPYAIPMQMVVKPLLIACLAALATTGAGAATSHARAQDGSQEAASQRRQSGHNLPLREIERRIVPTMPGAQYLGPSFDEITDVYTLKFLRNGSIIWLDVDGRTGRIVRRTGK